MKQSNNYSIIAYGMANHPFPAFWGNYKTLDKARAVAKQAIQDGWRECVIVLDAAQKQEGQGCIRTEIESITQTN